jgi:hypothetical protein
MNKKKKLIFITLLFLMFCYGFVSHKNKIFPYHIIKYFKQILLTNNVKLLSSETNKIKVEYKNWNKLNINYKKIFIKKYFSGLNIYSDRHYFNHKNDEKLSKLYLVQIPRHFKDQINLEVFNEVIIYRVLCAENNNAKYVNWERENYKLAIIGRSCAHTEIVKKKFKKGIIEIDPGGPISSDPIFIYDTMSNNKIFKLYGKF